MEKIAVLMSTYNGEQYIFKQLESIASQTVSDEVCLYVRDDGSQDNTLQIVREFQDRLKIKIVEGKNLGPAKSFWKLFTDPDIQADFYAFCDQDDIWDSDKLEIAISHLKQDTHLYACNYRSINEQDYVFQEKGRKTDPVICTECLFISGVTQGCAMVLTDELRKYILEKNICRVPMHDIVIMLYSIHFGSIFWDNLPHFSYRFHNDNFVANNRKRNPISYIKRMSMAEKNIYSAVAKELIENVNNFKAEEKHFLENISNYQFSTKKKMEIILNKKIRRCSKRALLSFYYKVAFNIL